MTIQEGSSRPGERLLTLELAGMLVFGGFVQQAAIDDPEGYDDFATLMKIGYLADLINAKCLATPEQAAPRDALRYARAAMTPERPE